MNIIYLKLNNGEIFLVGEKGVTSIYKTDENSVFLVYFENETCLSIPYHSVTYFQEMGTK